MKRLHLYDEKLLETKSDLTKFLESEHEEYTQYREALHTGFPIAVKFDKKQFEILEQLFEGREKNENE